MTTPVTNRTIRQFNLSDTNDVTLRMQGTSQRIIAKALDVKRDAEGRITYVCLDRLIHRDHENSFNLKLDVAGQTVDRGYVALVGCFATEMTFGAL